MIIIIIMKIVIFIESRFIFQQLKVVYKLFLEARAAILFLMVLAPCSHEHLIAYIENVLKLRPKCLLSGNKFQPRDNNENVSSVFNSFKLGVPFMGHRQTE